MPTKLHPIKTYANDEEKAKIEQRAAEKKLTVSNYIRKKLRLAALRPGRKTDG